jgi:hypothetical protein
MSDRVWGCGLLLALLLAAAPARAAFHEVHPDGSGDYATIQDAVDAATEGDTIVLTAGTFHGDGNRDIDFGGKNLTVRSASGDPADVILDCEAGESDQHRGFYFHSGEGASSLVRGITIWGGYLIFGGGVHIADCGPTIEDCVFRNNTSLAGAGIFCSNATATISGCRFQHNHATGAGAGIAFGSLTPPASRDASYVTRCIFYDNDADDTGAGIACDGTSPLLTECTFFANHTGSGGAAVFVGAGTHASPANTIIANTTGGAAVACEDGTATVNLLCCDLHANAEGDWVGCVAGQDAGNGNIALDPIFCDPEAGDVTLRSDSPCAPANSGGCGGIGAGPVACESPYHACCIGLTCLLCTEVECVNQGGDWYPGKDSCDPNPCPAMRACCHGGVCTLLTEDQCDALDGQWLFASSACTPDPCADVAACCVGTDCLLRSQTQCDLAGGSWHAGVGCGPHHDCALLRVCCVGTACYLAWPDECQALGGVFVPALAACAPSPCPVPAEPHTWGSIKALYRE